MTPGPLVHAEGLRLAYPGGFDLHLAELRIDAGERVALIGPSGSGKSTLIDAIAGIREVDGGRLRVLGRDWASTPERDRRAVRLTSIGMAFQEFELLQYLSARENIGLGRDVGAWSGPAADCGARVDQLARRAGISHTLDRRPDRLSQGERQRVSLCRALLNRPPLILCDEPTGNLDPASARAVMDLLLDQAGEDGAAVLLATHDHALLARFDRVVELPGRVP